MAQVLAPGLLCFAGKPPRLLAGNTGSGLYHSSWPVEEVVLSLLRVKEMQGISQEGVSAGCWGLAGGSLGASPGSRVRTA